MGYMASGKTTFGRALARKLGREFIDLDFYISQRFRCSVNEIFRIHGEEEFRRIEASLLREAGEFENVVISCGGGTPCFHSNIDYMLSSGITVWLTATEERMVERLVINNSRRPLMAGKSRSEIADTVRKGLAERTPYYSRSEITFSGEELENSREIDRTVVAFLETYSNKI